MGSVFSMWWADVLPGRPQTYVIFGAPGRMPGIKPEAMEKADMAIMPPGPAPMAAKLKPSVARLRRAMPPAPIPPLNFDCPICAMEGEISCLPGLGEILRNTCGICSGE